MRMALETGVFDVMCEKHGESVTAQELSKATGYDGLFIGDPLLSRGPHLKTNGDQLESYGQLFLKAYVTRQVRTAMQQTTLLAS